MSFYELFNEEPFKSVFDEVEEFTRRKLKDYNNHLEKITLSTRNKEIFDAVWGNIEFSAGEVYILDCPLLQRLRKIKQLGLAYFVYCGSDYSRFYHTTGVTFLADRMATSINKCNVNSEKKQEYFKAVVRLGAIFHDTGHMFLSHVSEHYFGKSPLFPRSQIISQMLEEFEKKGRKSVSLHELLSCMMVNTTEVRRLLRRVYEQSEEINLGSEQDLNKLVEYISGLIVGVPVDRQMLPYSSIINGPIDADKCDYLSRDSHVTRVPVAVDISRLTQKLSLVESKEVNTSDLWHIESESSMPYYELAMSDSAEKALFQLCIARTIMFDSVYYHHKVLTAETELRSLINELANLEDPIFTSFTEILEYTDDDFNKYFLNQLMSTRKGRDIERIKKVGSNLDKLYNRGMAKRVACIMPEFLDGSQSARERLFDEVLTLLDSSKEQNLLVKIREQYNNICVLLQEEYISKEDINIFIIQPPNILYGHSKIQVPINLYNGNQREFRGYELVSSRETSSSASYVVTDSEQKELVYLALEKVLFNDYKVLIKEECGACGKFNQEELRTYRTKLFRKAYYDDAPKLIRDELLNHYISDDQISALRNKFSVYDGPEGYSLDEVAIKNFFKQVIGVCRSKNQCKAIVNGIYKLLNASVFIDRKFVVNGIQNTLGNMNLAEKALDIIPLGGNKDSARHMMYYFNDVSLTGRRIDTEKRLEEVLESSENSAIVFIDDGSYSGKQMLSIMQEYMGISDSKRCTTEHHVNPLKAELREKLKKNRIIFFFLMFNSENQRELEQSLGELGFEQIEFAFSRDMSEKLLEGDSVLNSPNDRELVKNFLRDVGIGLLDSLKKKDGKYKERWSEERVRDSALGYNDAQQMVFLKDSVPTYTITPFWQEGRYGGVEWKPLFRRTVKD